MRTLKASDFATDREFEQAKRSMRKADRSKRAGRAIRRTYEAE